MSRHESDVEELAKKAAGNHLKFESFAWHHPPEDEEKWTLVYTCNRDSRLLEESNAAAIDKEMEKFTEGDDPDVRSERHDHWAVGWVDGYAIRVYDSHGAVTAAFRRWVELHDQLSDYPVLDDEDYSRRESEATLANIREIGRRFVRLDASPSWPDLIYSWLSDHPDYQRELENQDDQGGYPSDESVKLALLDLDLLDTLFEVRLDGELFFESDSRVLAEREYRLLAWRASLGLGPAVGRYVTYGWGDHIEETYGEPGDQGQDNLSLSGGPYGEPLF